MFKKLKLKFIVVRYRRSGLRTTPQGPRHIVQISPPPFGGGPYFSDAFLRPRLVLG